MKGFRLHIIATIIPLLLLAGGAQDCHAQRKTRNAVPVGAQAVWGEKKTDSGLIRRNCPENILLMILWDTLKIFFRTEF